MSKDILKAFKRETPIPVTRIRIERNGQTCLSVQCRHCEEPLCVYACLTGAMTRDPVSGTVSVDSNKCVGCWTCILVCPLAALVRNKERKVIAKCDLCPDRDVPACVTNCPNEALIYVTEQDATEVGI